jgi:hypothetical protein
MVPAADDPIGPGGTKIVEAQEAETKRATTTLFIYYLKVILLLKFSQII